MGAALLSVLDPTVSSTALHPVQVVLQGLSGQSLSLTMGVMIYSPGYEKLLGKSVKNAPIVC